jgi:hypothetical protein
MKGVGSIKGGTAPADTDRDGIPDDSERTMGLDPKNPADAARVGADGYTQIEHYLNRIAAPAKGQTNLSANVKLPEFSRAAGF